MKSVITLTFLFSVAALAATTPFKGEQAVVSSTFIYEQEAVSFPSSHASTIAETDEGVVAAWFGGPYERHPNVGIWFSRLVKGEWTPPVEVADGVQHTGLRYPTWNPVLFNYGDELFLFYKEGPSPQDWWGQLIISTDNGRTWSRRTRLPNEILGPIKNKPELLPNGELICPTSSEHDGWQVYMEITSDRGKTWERTAPINDGHEVAAIQPSILMHPDGKLQILCRSKNQRILSAWSDDNGRSWSQLEPINLPNPNSGTDAVTLQDGQHVLVYNHVDPDSEWGNRNILNVAISSNGVDWQEVALLEDDPDPDGEYSYPAVIQTSDGMVHITYTWNRKQIKHVVLDPAKFEPRSVSPLLDTTSNPVHPTNAEKLGYPKGTKVLLLHMDDLGMSPEANDAGKFYIENDYILSGAVMMPCQDAAPFIEWVKNVPQADIGVHLTLTSEWNTWRWSPLSKPEEIPGLIDPEGKMWRSVQEVVMNATPREVETEIRAQIDRMISLGLKPTHIDTHMGTLYGSPEYLKVFLTVAEEYKIPANAIDLSNPMIAEFYREQGYPVTDEVIGMLNAYSLPQLDNFGSVPSGDTYEAVKHNFFQYVHSLEPGITEIIFHPALESENMKTITGSWQQRSWEAQLFADPDVIRFFKENNIIITTWKEVMERFEAR